MLYVYSSHVCSRRLLASFHFVLFCLVDLGRVVVCLPASARSCAGPSLPPDSSKLKAADLIYDLHP